MKKILRSRRKDGEGHCSCSSKMCAKSSLIMKVVALVILFVGVMYFVNGMMIKSWINNNPDVIIESLNKHIMELQQKAQSEQIEKTKESLPKITKEIASNKSLPREGSKDADVVIVEFFDYNCGYCKAAAKTTDKVLKNDKKVAVVFVDLPIFGGTSLEAAKVALAINKISPDKHYSFHEALMNGNARTEEGIYEAVKKAGLDPKTVKNTVKKYSNELEDILANNKKYAQTLGLGGTPAFIIGEELIPGAIGYEDAQNYIKNARNK